MLCFSEQTGGGASSVEESLTDTDSVKGLGETTDFLNMVRTLWVPPEVEEGGVFLLINRLFPLRLT